MAAVIRAEPDWDELPAHTPQAIRGLLARCLKKDPRQRLQSIGDARIAIDEVVSGAPESASAIPAQNKWVRVLPWAVALLLGIIASVFVAGYFLRTPPPAAAIISQIEPPENTNFVLTGISAGPPTLSPDGHALAFTAASSDGRRMLWVQNLNSSAARSLDGTDAATFPFWSPDSRSLGFFAHGKLNRIAASGGPVFAICDVASARGGAWGTDGTILFGSLTGPLLRIPASGGTPQQATKLGEYITSHRWPQFLPDGKHFLFFEQSRGPSSAVSVGSLDGGQPKLLLRNDSSAGYAPPGYLLFVQQGTLMAQHFDAAKLQLVGDAMPLSAQATVDSGLFRSDFTVSESGILAYANGGVSRARLLWFDRSGKQLTGTGTAGVYGFPRISPDGRKLVVSIAQSGVTIFDLVRGTSMRLTFTPDSRAVPVWSPDGNTIAFVSSQNGYGKIYQKNADGTGVTMPLVVDDADNTLPSWSSDGRYLLYQRHSGQIHPWEIWAKPLFGDGKVFPVIQDPKFLEADAALSPDGKWLAHDSEETGSIEVYLTPFLHGGGKWEVSATGGTCPRWRADGRELFYVSLDNKIMSVEVSEQGSGVVIGTVRPLFQPDPVPSSPECMYDVTADGKKFVVVTQAAEQKSRPLTLVTNWPALLKKQ